jgi:hypothetical protein
MDGTRETLLDRARDLGAKESGLAVAATVRAGAGTFSVGTCTTAGGNLYVTIGRAHQGSYFSIVVAAPAEPGPVSGGLIQWGDSNNPVAIGADNFVDNVRCGVAFRVVHRHGPRRESLADSSRHRHVRLRLKLGRRLSATRSGRRTSAIHLARL